jgi:ATP-dependent Lon protease
VLPLRRLVVLPGERVTVPVGRPGSLAAVQAARDGAGLLLLCPQRDPEREQPGPEDLHPVGTLARLWDARAEQDGLRVEVEGLRRLRWTASPGAEEALGLWAAPPAAEVPASATPDPGDGAAARADAAPSSPAAGAPPAADAGGPRLPGASPAVPVSGSSGLEPEEPALADAVRWLWQQVQGLPELRAAQRQDWPPAERPVALIDALASRLLRHRQDRLEVLQRLDPAERLQALHQALLPRLPHGSAGGQALAERTRRQMERAQREYYLREQLRLIRRELGEEEDATAEADRFRAALHSAGLPALALDAGLREAARLERMPPLSAEAVIARSYLEWLTALPWNRRSPERLDLEAARALLDAEHEGLEDVKERILEHLAVHILRQQAAGGTGTAAGFPGGALCLAGPPGTGKTSLARSVALALGRPFVRVALGGVRDEAEIRGHRRTYVGALPGRIVAAMRRAGARNPVMLLDEIDKLGQGGSGDPGAALLEVLDPEQQAAFSDHYLEVPFDLSEVLFIATANELDALPPALRDRLEILPLPGYSEEQKVRIVARHLLPRQAALHALPAGALTLTPAALRALVRGGGPDAGLRGLERQVAAICRKAARAVVTDPGVRIRLDAAALDAWLAPGTVAPPAATPGVQGQEGAAPAGPARPRRSGRSRRPPAGA